MKRSQPGEKEGNSISGRGNGICLGRRVTVVIFEKLVLLKYKGTGHKVEGTGRVLSRE